MSLFYLFCPNFFICSSEKGQNCESLKGVVKQKSEITLVLKTKQNRTSFIIRPGPNIWQVSSSIGLGFMGSEPKLALCLQLENIIMSFNMNTAF